MGAGFRVESVSGPSVSRVEVRDRYLGVGMTLFLSHSLVLVNVGYGNGNAVKWRGRR